MSDAADSVRDSVRAAGKLARAGEPVEALGMLRRILATDSSPDTLARAGRVVQRVLAGPGGSGLPRPLSVALVGEVTTDWIAAALAAEAWRDGVLLDVSQGGFDNAAVAVMQGAATGRDAVVLLPWNRRLLAPDDRDADARIADELAQWSALWPIVSEAGARVVQVGLDARVVHPWSVAGGDAPLEPAALLGRVNTALREALPSSEVFVDLATIAADLGRRSFYDARRWLWTKQPFSEAGVAWLARNLWAALRASVQGPKKVLVLDLDDTLWGGVVGERGGAGVTLGDGPDGEAYVAFQREVARLSAGGVVLAVATKNEPADARAPFAEHPAMVLELSDFAAFEAGWGPKVDSLRRIAATLRLSLDSFVFFDDSPFERGHVAMALPQVRVVDVPTDPADYVAALAAECCFASLGTTAEDRARTRGYVAEAHRTQAREGFGSTEDYLRSLQLRGTVAPIDARSLPRVAQLVGKTNQFNLTTRRHSAADIEAMLARPGAIGRTLTLSDRFGDYGLIAAVLAVPEGDRLRVDTLLMSCRAIGRTAEDALWGSVLEAAREAGVASIVGEYEPTPNNGLVADLWSRWGLRPEGERWIGSVAELTAPETFVDLGASAEDR